MLQRLARGVVRPVPVLGEQQAGGALRVGREDGGERFEHRRLEVLTSEMARHREQLALDREEVEIERDQRLERRFHGADARNQLGHGERAALLLLDAQRAAQRFDKGQVRGNPAI